MKLELEKDRFNKCFLNLRNQYGDFEIEHKYKEGRNNCVLRIVNKQKQKFILKIYPKNDSISLDKFKKEISFLKYLEKIKYLNVPKLVNQSEKDMYIIITFLEGEKIYCPDRELNNKFFEFIQEINKSTSRENIKMLGLASEASLDPKQLLRIIDKRITDLNVPLGFGFNDLNKFFCQEVIPNWRFIKKNINVNDIDFKLDKSQLIASPSDVGFHNCLRINSKVFFFDFEHSGLDDIAKLAIDFTLQPDSINHPKYLEDMLLCFSKIDGLNINWLKRFQKYLDIYRIKWILIMLKRLKINFRKNSKGEIDMYFSKIKNYYNKSKFVVENSKKICFDFYNTKKEDD